MTTPLVFADHGKVLTTSIAVSEYFEKNHRHVLEKIRALIEETPFHFNEPNFRPVDYTDAKGEKRPSYQITRDGFTLLAMRFTGKKALEWQIKYIEAFNQLEAELAGKRQAPRRYSALDPAQRNRVLVTFHNGTPVNSEVVPPEVLVMTKQEFMESLKRDGKILIDEVEWLRLQSLALLLRHLHKQTDYAVRQVEFFEDRTGKSLAPVPSSDGRRDSDSD